MSVLKKLIDKGYLLEDKRKENIEYQHWDHECIMVIAAKFGHNSDERGKFIRSGIFDSKISVLETLLEKEENQKSFSRATTQINLNQTQFTNIQNEINLQILLKIENSSELNDTQKDEIKAIFEEVKSEVQKDKTNWEKVKELLKRSFDYGLKIAPDLVKLADTYYKAKS